MAKSHTISILILLLIGCSQSLSIRSFTLPGPYLMAKRQPPLYCTSKDPMLAIVIDDIGRKDLDYQLFKDIHQSLTFSVFPCAKHTRNALNALINSGHEVIGHIPMQPINSCVMEPDLTFLLTNDSSQTIQTKFKIMLGCLYGIKGINNHMGSKFTANKDLLLPIMEVLKKRNLYFLDSRTTPDTKAFDMARQFKIPALKKDWFIDDKPSVTYVYNMLKKVANLAIEQDCAIAIGHPYNYTAMGIKKFLKDQISKKVRIVPLSCLFFCHHASLNDPETGE